MRNTADLIKSLAAGTPVRIDQYGSYYYSVEIHSKHRWWEANLELNQRLSARFRL